MRDVLLEVREIVSGVLVVSTHDVLAGSDIIEDLGADSMDLVEMLLEAEERFQIDIPDDDVVRIRTVQEATDYIAKRLAVSLSDGGAIL